MKPRHKYPRTPHLPWSRPNKDDGQLADVSQFAEMAVVVTEKLDGENTTMGSDYVHARSLDSRHHESRAWVKGLHATIASRIPAGWRLCGENMYAKHSIFYDKLDSYFYLFSVWNADNNCLSWDDTETFASELGLVVPRVLFRGVWDEKAIKALVDTIDTKTCEGYVVRDSGGFAHAEFAAHAAKWVRLGHVQTDEHWMARSVVPNQLRSEATAADSQDS